VTKKLEGSLTPYAKTGYSNLRNISVASFPPARLFFGHRVIAVAAGKRGSYELVGAANIIAPFCDFSPWR
jgi:hypothetical protein